MIFPENICSVAVRPPFQQHIELTRRLDVGNTIPPALLHRFPADFMPSFQACRHPVFPGPRHGPFGNKRLKCIHAQFRQLPDQTVHFTVFQHGLRHDQSNTADVVPDVAGGQGDANAVGIQGSDDGPVFDPLAGRDTD